MRYPFHSFGLPAAKRFYAEDDGGNATTGTGEEPANSDSALTDFRETSPQERVERVEGEKPPDFGKLFGKKPEETASEPSEGGKTTQKEEKPRGEAPAKPTTPAKTAAKPKETAPKVSEPAKPAAKEEKPPAKPAVKTEAKPAEKVEESKLPEVPENDDDIEALKPKAGAPTQIIESFTKMKELMKTERSNARAALAEAVRIKAEVTTLKESSGKLPEEVTKELESLRKFNLLWQAEQSPVFKQEFDTKLQAAEESVYGFLTKHGLNPKVIESIKAAASKAGGDIEAWPQLSELIDAFKNKVDQKEFLDALKGRRDIIGARSARLAELGTSREKFMEEYGKQEDNSRQAFAKGVEQASIPLAAANPWILERTIPEDATKEQREAIESENAEVKKRADAFGDAVRDLYARTPDKAAEIALKAVEADYLRTQVEDLTTAKDKAQARVTELEKQLARIRSAGRTAHIDSPSDTPRKAAPETATVGGDGSSAIRDFQWGKRSS